MVHKYEVKIRKLKKQIEELEMNWMTMRYNSNTRDLASSDSLSIPIFDR